MELEGEGVDIVLGRGAYDEPRDPKSEVPPDGALAKKPKVVEKNGKAPEPESIDEYLPAGSEKWTRTQFEEYWGTVGTLPPPPDPVPNDPPKEVLPEPAKKGATPKLPAVKSDKTEAEEDAFIRAYKFALQAGLTSGGAQLIATRAQEDEITAADALSQFGAEGNFHAVVNGEELPYPHPAEGRYQLVLVPLERLYELLPSGFKGKTAKVADVEETKPTEWGDILTRVRAKELSVRQAADQLGVSKATIYRRLKGA